MLWIFDMDNTVYGPANIIKQTVVQRMKIVLSKLVGIKEEEFISLQELLKNKHKTDDTVLAFALEFHLPYENLIRQIYLASDLSVFSISLRKGAHHIPQLPGQKWILTNSPYIFAKEILAFLNIGDWFQQIHANGPKTLIKKPLASAYRHIEYHGRIIMVEDSEKNLVVPKRLGWTTVWFLEQPQKSPLPTHIDYQIQDLASLCDLI